MRRAAHFGCFTPTQVSCRPQSVRAVRRLARSEHASSSRRQEVTSNHPSRGTRSPSGNRQIATPFRIFGTGNILGRMTNHPSSRRHEATPFPKGDLPVYLLISPVQTVRKPDRRSPFLRSKRLPLFVCYRARSEDRRDQSTPRRLASWMRCAVHFRVLRPYPRPLSTSECARGQETGAIRARLVD